MRGPLNGQRRQWVSAILIACSTLTATGLLPAALPAIRALISGLPDISILFRKGTDGAYGNDESQPLQATCHRTGERLIRLTMALFYGQTISVRYIIRQFDVSPRTARRDLTHLAFVLESAGPHRWRLAPSLKP